MRHTSRRALPMLYEEALRVYLSAAGTGREMLAQTCGRLMKLDRFALFTWAVLAYNLVVVIWGAFVRATGSGAGCGSHWPLCNGDVVPRAPEVATMIEFTHRVTSGLALVAVVVMLVWAYRAFPVGHRVRFGAKLSLILIIIEALLGAGLVLFELVADNASRMRAFSMVAHLVNTFLLLGALTITAWWASGGRDFRLRGQGRVGTLLLLGTVGILLVGATGAIAALGDTLFPSASLGEGLRDSFSRDSHPLVRLRKLHPFIAIGVGLFLILAARLIARVRPSPLIRRLADTLVGLYLLQIFAGVVNVILLAPVWMQLVHLLLGDFVWIAFVLLAASALAAETSDEPGGKASRSDKVPATA
jgi:heme A synthase